MSKNYNIRCLFHFFKLNNVYEGEPFVLEDSLIHMYPSPPTTFPLSKEKEWEKQIQNGTWDRKWVDELIDKLV